MSTLSVANLSDLSGGTAINIGGGTPEKLVLSTAQATTSGTSIDFTGIPSWVKRITVIFSDVSTSGTSQVEIRLGTSGGIVSTGYSSSCQTVSAGNVSSSGFVVDGSNSATFSRAGNIFIFNISGNSWVASGTLASAAGSTTVVASGGGKVALSGVLTQLRITTANGTDTFDAGSVNILYEG